MTAHSIASKFRRAIRNGTGATFTNEQLQEMAGYGLLKTLALIESEELCPERLPPTSSVTSGSTKGGTENRPTSGRLPPTGRERGPLSIEALSAGI